MEGEAIYILKFHPELENNLKVNIRNTAATDNRLMQNNSLSVPMHVGVGSNPHRGIKGTPNLMGQMTN